ncbi:hypothetical protein BGX38DRAFT_122529 [Terfezia claveryi]|nr:hypothetical protein BGX38DRAFT_122529 [Terfezia claveryi]
MTTQESRIPLNPQASSPTHFTNPGTSNAADPFVKLSKHNADNEVRTTMDDATLEELKGIMQFYVQGIQERQGQFVRLYHGAISRDSSALESVKMWLDHLAEREPQGDPLEMAFLQLLLDFEAKGKRISELMGEVLRLGDNRVQGSKDDHYFGQRLTGVFREVEDWVYQTFNNAPDIQHLGQEAEYSCSEAAGDWWRELLEKEHILLFTRVVTMELVKNVLEPRLLGINHDYIRLILPAIEESFVKSIPGLPLLMFTEFI